MDTWWIIGILLCGAAGPGFESPKVARRYPARARMSNASGRGNRTFDDIIEWRIFAMRLPGLRVGIGALTVGAGDRAERETCLSRLIILESNTTGALDIETTLSRLASTLMRFLNPAQARQDLSPDIGRAAGVPNI